MCGVFVIRLGARIKSMACRAPLRSFQHILLHTFGAQVARSSMLTIPEVLPKPRFVMILVHALLLYVETHGTSRNLLVEAPLSYLNNFWISSSCDACRTRGAASAHGEMTSEPLQDQMASHS